jgi:orotidine-5'-phosphate decarboxylase
LSDPESGFFLTLNLGVSIFNVHAAGGSEMMRRTVGAVAESVDVEKLRRPAIIAVTVLTSANSNTLGEIGLTGDVNDVVRRLALLAEASGLDGVVASPLELGIVRSAVKKTGFVVVTPGVRPAGFARGDQKRVTTPREAILAGADYLVVGRPILQAPDPARAAQAIIDEMEIVAAKGLS